MYCKLLDSGKIVEIRITLTNHYIVRYPDGTTEKVLKTNTERIYFDRSIDGMQNTWVA